jgi:CheY-like chemotaxis protein
MRQILPQTGREGRNLRLYLADDAESVRAQIRGWARDPRSALRVEEFTSARGLLRRAACDPPDLALVDLTLPGLDGRTALRALRGDRVPVALLSPATAEAARSALEGLIEGAVECFWKRRRDRGEHLAVTRAHFLERTRALVTGPARVSPETIRCGRVDTEAPLIELALARTRALGPMLRWLGQAPARPAASMLIGAALPRRPARVLAECAARLGNRPVLQLEDGEPVRPGRWRVIPGRAVAVPVRRGEEWVWRLLAARETGEACWIARQIAQLGGAAAGPSKVHLFSEPDARALAAFGADERDRLAA